MNGNTKPALSCFVLMPSGVGGEYHYHIYQANHVYEDIIKPAAVAAATRLKRKISVDRESDSSLSGGITKSILRKIASADIVIADVTGRNANVFLELGIRYSIAKKITILLNEHKAAQRSRSPLIFAQ